MSNTTPAPNAHLAKIFDALATQSEVAGTEGSQKTNAPHKARHFKRVAKTLRALSRPIVTVECAKGMPGFGKGTLRRIEEALRTGGLAELQAGGKAAGETTCAKATCAKATCTTTADPVSEARISLQTVTGIGPRKANELANHGATLAELLAIEQRAREHNDTGALETLRRYGITEHQKLGLRFYEDLRHRIPREVIARLDRMLRTLLPDSYDFSDGTTVHTPGASRGGVIVCGSYRRGEPSSGDIDLLLTHAGWEEEGARQAGLREALARLRPAIVANLTQEPKTKYMGFVRIDGHPHVCRLDVRAVAAQHFVPAVMYFTGSQQENIRLRRKAQSMSMKLSEYGLVREFESGATIPLQITTERDVYEALDEEYVVPQNR